MESFWQQKSAGDFPTASGTIDADIAIVGGGYTGSWLAYWLRNRGLSVVLLEAQTPGYGASGRNGGLMLQGPAELLSDASETMGEEKALELARMTRQSFPWIQEINTRYPVDFRVTGSLYLAGGADERDAVQKTAALYQKVGVAARLLEPHEQAESLRRLDGDWALWIPDDGMVHPLKLIHALLLESSQGGVMIYAHAPVSDIEDRGASVRLGGPSFRVRAERAVLCTNAYTFLGPPIQTVRGQVLVTEPLPCLDHPYPVYHDRGFNYWHQRPDGRLVAGGFRYLAGEEELGTDLILHPAIQKRLDTLVTTLVGRPVGIERRWAGIMGMTPDHHPYLGPLSQSLWIAAGFNGHGSTVTPVAARMIRDALLDGKPIFEPFSLSPGRMAS